MPNTNTYHFYIRNLTGAEEETPVAGQGGQNAPIATPNQTATKNVSKGDISALVAYRKAKPFFAQVINNEVQRVSLRTGSNRVQEKASFINSVVGQTVGFVESVAFGAYAGGLVGALVGAGLSVAHTLITYSNNQQNIDLQQSIERVSIQQNYIRAGAQGSRARNE